MKNRNKRKVMIKLLMLWTLCFICREQDLISKATELYKETTVMNVTITYDEYGNETVDDPNIITIGFLCSNGHEFSYTQNEFFLRVIDANRYMHGKEINDEK